MEKLTGSVTGAGDKGKAQEARVEEEEKEIKTM